MKRTLAPLLFTSATFLSATASADAPKWVDRHVVPNADVAGSVDLGFGLGSRAYYGPVNDRYTGVGFNFEGAISFARRVEIGLRTGLRAPNEGKYAQADSYARPFDGNTFYDWTNGQDTFANPEVRVRVKVVETRVFELALEGRGYLPVADGTRYSTLFSVPMQIHSGIFRADINPGFVVGFYNQTAFVFSVPVNLWFQVTPKVWLGPLTGFRAYNRNYYYGSSGLSAVDLILGFGVGVSVTPFLDIKTQLLFPRINDGADWFGAGVALGFVFDPN